MVIHTVIVDLKAPGISFLVTPGDPQAEFPLQASTTSRFLQEFNALVAVNGDGLTPWYYNNPFDYYPHSGDPVDPIGLAASRGVVYTEDTDDEPTLYISRTNQARFGTPTGKVYNAISGNVMLIQQGRSVVGPDVRLANERQTEKRAEGKRADREKAGAEAGQEENLAEDLPQPRTAVALDKSGRRLIILVVDGRQPNYSEGATLEEVAELLLAKGGHTGMNLDGGGSSTLAVEGANGRPDVLNSPIHQRIPGRERPVGNHLGIFAER
jgi:exopolysaccharide biosynthesis protein